MAWDKLVKVESVHMKTHHDANNCSDTFYKAWACIPSWWLFHKMTTKFPEALQYECIKHLSDYYWWYHAKPFMELSCENIIANAHALYTNNNYSESCSWYLVTCFGLMYQGVIRSTIALYMMPLSNGNIFRVTGPLWGEYKYHRWVPLTKASDRELWCFLRSTPEQTVAITIETPVIWDSNYIWTLLQSIVLLIATCMDRCLA